MGLFDIFKGKSKDTAADGGEKKGKNPAAKWAEAAGNKRAQTYDRQEAINELIKLETPEAAEALLKRFTFSVDPSITDQEEKEVAYEGIVSCGRGAIEPIRKFVAKAESVQTPIRILKAICEKDEVVEELLKWLSKWDTEYAKFIDPKVQILQELEELTHPDIREAVERFLEDANDPARFHAVGATLAQKNAASIGPLLKLLLEEESVRIKSRIADGFIANDWEVPDDQRDAARKALPHNYGIDGSGKMTKR